MAKKQKRTSKKTAPKTKITPIVIEKHPSGLEVRRRGDDAYIVFKTGAAMKLSDYEKRKNTSVKGNKRK